MSLLLRTNVTRYEGSTEALYYIGGAGGKPVAKLPWVAQGRALKLYLERSRSLATNCMPKTGPYTPPYQDELPYSPWMFRDTCRQMNELKCVYDPACGGRRSDIPEVALPNRLTLYSVLAGRESGPSVWFVVRRAFTDYSTLMYRGRLSRFA